MKAGVKKGFLEEKTCLLRPEVGQKEQQEQRLRA